MSDLISRQAAIDELNKLDVSDGVGISSIACDLQEKAIRSIENLPAVQPFHNTTMNEVLRYIDDMPEDEWQEFTACLECRGWKLQRRTAKWCGGDFA